MPKDIDRLETVSEWSGPHFRRNREAKGVALRAGVRSTTDTGARRFPVLAESGAEHALLQHRQFNSLYSPKPLYNQ